MSRKVDLGIIGGSGLYEMDGLEDVSRESLETPFGSPSDSFVLGTLAGKRIAFLPRHGLGHRLTPSQLNYRANIYGFKMLGAPRIMSVTAVGSLREKIKPLDLVVPDQLFDRTSKRIDTFFDQDLVAHVSLSDPFCPELTRTLYECAGQTGVKAHQGGTLITIEGPAFSTKAESDIYRQWGMDIIGMTTFQEARLAREAEICFAALALVTDYDCWKQDECVSVEDVVNNLQEHSTKAKEIIGLVAASLNPERNCPCPTALKGAIMTDPSLIPPRTREILDLLIGKYL